ncbi:MAG: hypothetical protein KAT68_00340 [Bacteroidales bacterium]|nr:hypothetical protein [Bacteroidales bacterium]
MKPKIFITIGILILIILSLSNNLSAQRCDKQKYFDKDEFEDFDYRGQSSYAVMRAGETARVKIVFYSGQDYKIMIGGEQDFGQIQFKIIKEKRLYKKFIKEVTSEEVAIYQENEYGAYETDIYGDYIQTGTEIQYDTIWGKERIIEENLVFNNLNNKENKKYYTTASKKTHVLIIEVIIPKENSGFEGCVQILVGHRTARKKAKFISN